MNTNLKKYIAACLLSALIVFFINANAFAQIYEPTPAAQAVDVLVARPLGVASQVVGCVFFVASLPFSVPSKSVPLVFDKTLVEPAKFTWTRPIGIVN